MRLPKYPLERWLSLGPLIRERRVEVGGHNRQAWCRGRNMPSAPLFAALEKSTRPKRVNFEDTTIWRVEHALQLRRGAITDYLAGLTDQLEPKVTSSAENLRATARYLDGLADQQTAAG
jgi:hypothetical protein